MPLPSPLMRSLVPSCTPAGMSILICLLVWRAPCGQKRDHWGRKRHREEKIRCVAARGKSRHNGRKRRTAPLQSPHFSATTSPVPSHWSHTTCVCMMPKAVRWT